MKAIRLIAKMLIAVGLIVISFSPLADVLAPARESVDFDKCHFLPDETSGNPYSERFFCEPEKRRSDGAKIPVSVVPINCDATLPDLPPSMLRSKISAILFCDPAHVGDLYARPTACARDKSDVVTHCLQQKRIYDRRLQRSFPEGDASAAM